MSSRCFGVFALLVLLVALVLPAHAQDDTSTDIVAMSVETGYDNYFRPNYWMPLRVNVRNNGDAIDGKIIVRPETSGRVVSNAYSTPIDLPTGSEKTAFLYVQARANPNRLIVELIDSEGVRIAEQSVGTIPLNTHDALHVVVSDTTANSIPLNELAVGGYDAGQARWTLGNLPPNVAPLLPIDTLILYEVNTDNLTVGQREALEEYVVLGGHLMVIGGPSYQPTSVGIEDLLPFTPNNSQSIDDVTGYAAFAGDFAADLSTRNLIATGEVKEGAQVLASTEDGEALLVRWQYGSGTVDYMTADPTLEPLRSWEGLSDMWWRIMTSTQVEPSWTRGILESQDAARAIAILPDVNLLPPVLSMVAFIALYIALIGPANYVLLSRINRPAWAWFTIPLFIGAFSLVAWTVGFNLRGSEIFVSRVNVVQSYPNTDIARIDQLIGILSPRRETYRLAVPDERFLDVMPALERGGILQQSITVTGTEIVQTEDFAAENVAIDGGIFANFATLGTIEAPDIRGSVTITHTEDGTTLLGTLRNNSGINFDSGLILTRNGFYRIDDPIASGDVLNFDGDDMTDIEADDADLLPHASPFERVYTLDLGNEFRNTSATSASLVTSRVIADQRNTRRANDEEEELTEEQRRRYALVRSFVRDQFGTPAIGHQAYFFGWTTQNDSRDIDLNGVDYRTVDTVLHIVGLDARVEKAPASTNVTVSPDQFTWAVRDRDNVEGGLNDLLVLNPGYINIRFTPVQGAVLDAVNGMTLTLDRTSSLGRSVEVLLWDWEQEEWSGLPVTAREIYEIEDFEPFLGPDNMVDVRLELTTELQSSSASARIRGITIRQTGNFGTED